MAQPLHLSLFYLNDYLITTASCLSDSNRCHLESFVLSWLSFIISSVTVIHHFIAWTLYQSCYPLEVGGEIEMRSSQCPLSASWLLLLLSMWTLHLHYIYI